MAGEKRIENSIKKYLKSKGSYVLKQHGSSFTKVGIPDILVCYKGLFIGIEVKDIGKKPSEAQIVNINNIKKAGGYAIWTDKLEDVVELIERIDDNDVRT